MVNLIEYTPHLIAIFLATFLAPFLHEGGHWFVGKLGNSDPKVHFILFIIPSRVSHRNIEDINPQIIRISGFSPFLWIPGIALSLTYMIMSFNPWTIFAFLLVLGTVAMSTESDAIAFRNPEKYRQMSINDEFEGIPLFFSRRSSFWDSKNG